MEDLQANSEGNFQSSGSANVILYVGLGMIAIGLVITFVGLGDKGFKTLELKLIGPSLVGCGVFFALLRILFCTVPSCCRSCVKCCSKSDESEKLIKKDTRQGVETKQNESEPRLSPVCYGGIPPIWWTPPIWVDSHPPKPTPIDWWKCSFESSGYDFSYLFILLRLEVRRSVRTEEILVPLTRARTNASALWL